MKNIIQPLKGTRDFYPEDMAVRTWLYQNLREISESFGYQEYEGPLIETLELYAAKSGEELVKEQSFVFRDRGGEEITLRPELTPSLARMIAQRQNQLVYPLRWWSWGPMWRYEQPQKGRTREFFQWNVDLIGVDTPEADAELAAVIAALFKKVGLKSSEVQILVNDRRLMDKELNALGIPAEKKPQVSRYIDRRDKLGLEDWEAYGRETVGLNQAQIDGLKAILGNDQLWRKSDELTRYFAAVEAMCIQDYVRYDPGIVRGLDYYTGTVWEAVDISGSVRRAILGGGRYDNLMSAVGGDPLPAVGFAMGDVVISLILKERGLLPQKAEVQGNVALMTVFDQASMPASLALAAQLRQAGLRVATYPLAAKLPKQFKYADRMGIPIAIVLGPDEQASGKVTIKNMIAGEQQTVEQSQAAEAIKKVLASRTSS